MRTFTFLICLGVLLQLNLKISVAQSPEFLWGSKGKGTWTTISNSVLDSKGKLVFMGKWRFYQDFGPGTTAFSFPTNQSRSFPFLAKYNGNNFYSAKSFQGYSNENKYFIGNSAIDQNDNLYFYGNTTDSVFVMDTVSIRRKINGLFVHDFLGKLDSTGNPLWLKPAILTRNLNYTNGIQKISFINNGCLVFGLFKDTVLIGGQNFITKHNAPESYLAKFDVSGNVSWALETDRVDTTFSDAITFSDFSTDASGNCYIIGDSRRLFTIGQVTSPQTTFYGSNYKNFIIKVDANGNVIWIKWFSSTTDALELISIKLAYFNDNELYLAGEFPHQFNIGTQSVNNNSNFSDFFIAKIDSNLNCNWMLKNTNVSSLLSLGESVTQLRVDPYGNPIILGSSFSKKLIFGNDSLVEQPNSNGLSMFIAKCDAQGNPLWLKGCVDGDFVEKNLLLDSLGGHYLLGAFTTYSQTPIHLDTISFLNSYIPPSGNTTVTYFITYLADPLTLASPEISNNTSWNVYPNPFSNDLKIQFNNQLEYGTIKIQSVLGQTMFESNKVTGKEFNIQPKNLPVGIYILSIFEKGKLIGTKKIAVASN